MSYILDMAMIGFTNGLLLRHEEEKVAQIVIEFILVIMGVLVSLKYSKLVGSPNESKHVVNE